MDDDDNMRRAGGGAAERVLDVIELLVGHRDGVALSDIARELNLAKSAVHRLLSSLSGRGFVEQPEGRESYRLSLKLSALGMRHAAELGMLDICQPILDRLAKTTGELVRMAVADNRGLTWVAKAQGARFGLRYDPDMGSPVVLHATASGRAWLGTMAEADALAMVEALGFAVPGRFGNQRIRSIEDLALELDRTKRRGHALAVEEGEAGTCAIALPIRAEVEGRAPGTISVAGPITRMNADRLEEILPHLEATATEIGALWAVFQLHND